jgi:hypothetical protein
LDDAYTADFAVVRALLRKGRAYEQAVKSFEPYRLIQELTRGVAERARRERVPAFLFVNNRLEGNGARQERREVGDHRLPVQAGVRA